MKSLAPQQRIAPASLKSVAPVRWKRFARSRRNCTASPTLIGSGAMRRIRSLSSVAVPDLGENGGGEKWRWVSKPKPQTPWPSASGYEGE
jgi:hypothetical protein